MGINIQFSLIDIKVLKACKLYAYRNSQYFLRISYTFDYYYYYYLFIYLLMCKLLNKKNITFCDDISFDILILWQTARKIRGITFAH